MEKQVNILTKLLIKVADSPEGNSTMQKDLDRLETGPALG